MDLTVIVPVYNGGKHISRCLDSLLEQKNIKLNVLIVNDGSTDDTKEIIETYEHKYENFHVIHQQNQGTFMARMNGIRNVDTEYVTFCDSDDYLDENFYYAPLRRQQQSGADIVEFGCRMIKDGKVVKEKIPSYDTISGDQAVRVLMETRMIESYNCNKLYRTKLFKNSFIPKMQMIVEEDRFLNLIAFRNANRIMAFPGIGYNYVWTAGSSTNTTAKYYGLKAVQSQKMIYEHICRWMPEAKRSAAYDYCARMALCCLKLQCHGKKQEAGKVIQVFRRICKENRILLYVPKGSSKKRIAMIHLIYFFPKCITLMYYFYSKRGIDDKDTVL